MLAQAIAVDNVLLATQCYFAHGDIQNRKVSFNPSPGKTEVGSQSNVENIQAVYLLKRALRY
jgi:hypothetical protein